VVQPGGTSLVSITPGGGLRPYCVAAVVAETKKALALSGPASTGCSCAPGFGCASGTTTTEFKAPLDDADGISNNIVITVSDRTGAKVETSRSVTMRSNLDVVVSANPSTVLPGGRSTVKATVTRGPHEVLSDAEEPADLYTYTFSVLGMNGLLRGPVSTKSLEESVEYVAIQTSNAQTRSDVVRVTVQDKSGAIVTKDFPIAIVAAEGLTVEIQAGSTVPPNGQLDLTALVRGNIGSLSYLWETVSHQGCFVAGNSCLTSGNNTGSTVVWRADGVSSGSSVSFKLTVTDSSRSSPAVATHSVLVGLQCGSSIDPAAAVFSGIDPIRLCPTQPLVFSAELSLRETPGTVGQTLFWLELAPTSLPNVGNISLSPIKPTDEDTNPPVPIPSENVFKAGAFATIRFPSGVGAALDPDSDGMAQLDVNLIVRDRCQKANQVADTVYPISFPIQIDASTCP
jgi:hypothetical protein